MPISRNDIRFYYSGGASNANPLNSIGGEISNFQVFNDITENIFDNVTKTEADNGHVEYRCIYVKNDGDTQWNGVLIWQQQPTTSTQDGVFYGIGTAPINGTEQGPLANSTTAPTGVNFSDATGKEDAFLLGNLAPGAYKSVWLRRSVAQGASTFKFNSFVIRVQSINPPGSGTGGGGGPTVPEPGGGSGGGTGTGGGSGSGSGGGGTTDSRGLKWFFATGEQGVIPQTRNQSSDKRWSGNVSNVLGGYEVTAIVSHSGVSSGGHMALKHWGPNHSGSCGHKESGSCCCFPAGYKVDTINGLIPIEQIKLGDKVYTHKGRYNKVLELYKHKHDGNIYSIKTYGTSNYELSTTANHKFLTKRGWVRAHELTKNDWLYVPIEQEIIDLDKISIPYTNRHKQYNVQCNTTQSTMDIKLNEDLLTIIGYYLAEGSLRKSEYKNIECENYRGIVFTFGDNINDKPYVDSLTNSISNIGFKSHKYYRKEYNTCIIDVYSTPFASWLGKEFGNGAKNKKIPHWIATLPNNKLKILFEAYMNGDGYRVSKGNHNSRHVKSISENLINDMRKIALRLGYKTSIRKHNTKPKGIIQGRVVNQNIAYELYVTEINSKNEYNNTNNSKIKIDKDYQYQKIRSIKIKPFNNMVYNIEVDQDHSYTIGSTISCLNCWYDFGIRSNGNVQTEIERPHPNNDDVNLPSGHLKKTNIGKSMGSGYIGLKWLVYPVTFPGGTSNNGGIVLKMWADIDPLNAQGQPNNNWELIIDTVDTGNILGNYNAPSEHDIEMRISDTDDVETFGGGLHWRKLRRPEDFLPPSGGGGSGSNTGGGSTELPDFTMTAMGDTTCGSAAQDNFAHITARNPNVHLQLGDYTYTSSTTCYRDLTRNLNQQGKIKQVVIGNHDDEEDESNSLRSAYLQEYGQTLPYHSFTFRNVHVLTLYTYAPYGYGTSSNQYQFALNDLQAARNDSTIEWIIVCFHKPIYTITGGGNHGPESSFRDIYHPLFDQFKVDLILTGHNHNYQRTLPIKHSGGSNPTVVNTHTSTYQDLVNPIHLVVGTGGRSLDSVSGAPSYNAAQRSSHGYLHLVWSNNGKKLTGRFYNRQDVMQDEFVISKSVTSTPPPPPPSGGGGTGSGTVGNDPFGKRKIYPTKANGDQWYFDISKMQTAEIIDSTTGNSLGSFTISLDPRFWIELGINLEREVNINGDGSISIFNKFGGGSWLDIFTAGNNINTLPPKVRGTSPPMQSFNFTQLASIGYWYQANDWLNTEFTVYFKPDGFNSNSHGLSLISRSLFHGTQTQLGCPGAGYHGNIQYTSNAVRFIKEPYHPQYNLDPFLFTNIPLNQWIGMKLITYNKLDGTVGLELWLDKDDNNVWTQYISRIDDGLSWGNSMSRCNAISPTAAITWGSPIAMIKWTVNQIRFKNMSVREISPPT